MARLLMNLILMINSYPLTIIRYEDRDEYINSINRAQVKEDLTEFYLIIITSVERMLDALSNLKVHKPSLPVLMNMSGSLKIGEFAELARETKVTIRYWTKIGLLKAKFTKSGYALYDSKEVAVVNKIRNLQDKDLSLKEIREKLRG